MVTAKKGFQKETGVLVMFGEGARFFTQPLTILTQRMIGLTQFFGQDLVAILKKEDELPNPVPDTVKFRNQFVESEEKKLVVDVGRDDVVFDIGNQLIDEFDMVDILLDEQLLMKIIADAVG